jgi:hypothetical protein
MHQNRIGHWILVAISAITEGMMKQENTVTSTSPIFVNMTKGIVFPEKRAYL